MLKSLGFGFLLALVPCCFYAQDLIGSEQERKQFESALAALKLKNPIEYRRTQVALTLATEMLLGRLGYGVGAFDGEMDEKLAAALRLYQEKRRIPATGDPMSFDAVEQVRKDTRRLDQSPVDLPRKSIFIDLWDRGYLSAEGTWTILGDKMAWPEQTTTIQCDRAEGVCREATAIVSSFDSGGRHLQSIDIDTYEIERWDEKEIVTKPLDPGLGCVRHVRRINRVQKSVTGVRSTTSNDGLCAGVTNAEFYIVLSDGFEIAGQMQRQQQDEMFDLMQISPSLLRFLRNDEQK